MTGPDSPRLDCQSPPLAGLFDAPQPVGKPTVGGRKSAARKGVLEAARRLRIGRTTCFALIRTGELESIDIGRLRRVPADAPAEYLARRRAAKRAA